MADTKQQETFILDKVFDRDNNRLRVDSTVTATIGTVDVIIDASADNIAISDGTNTLEINGDGSINTVTKVYATRLDEASSTVTYVGDAVVGSSPSAASWSIKKIDETSGIVITFADGNANYDNVWDNRASLTYT